MCVCADWRSLKKKRRRRRNGKAEPLSIMILQLWFSLQPLIRGCFTVGMPGECNNPPGRTETRGGGRIPETKPNGKEQRSVRLQRHQASRHSPPLIPLTASFSANTNKMQFFSPVTSEHLSLRDAERCSSAVHL